VSPQQLHSDSKIDSSPDAMACFHPVTAAWFKAVFEAPTAPQRMGWPVIARGESALILAPTGTGKTLAAFLWCLDRLMLEGRERGNKGTREQESREQGNKEPREQENNATKRNLSQGALHQGAASAAPKTLPKKSGALAPGQTDRSRGCRIVYVSPLKALAVDVERNLRSPLAGMANMARRMGVAFHEPQISVRTGDTPQRERARFARHPADILITTPESLYLLLTSQAAEALRTVETVIIDEIHALVPTKRGAHLALTLERLAALTGKPLQRIGLSATQRPLEEVARFLGGIEVERTRGSESAGQQVRESARQSAGASVAQDGSLDLGEIADPGALRYRPVTIVNATARKQLKLRIEVPVEDMARLGEMEEIPSGPASQTPRRVSIWNAIHPRLLEIIRERNSTILFVNARQTAERLAGALNDLAGEPIARAHHGVAGRGTAVG
jgi:ATP-dependent Lhr-like helicase